MKMTKKVLSVLLSLMLVLGAASAGGMSASAELSQAACLIIGGVYAIEDGDIVLYEGTGWRITETGNGVTLNLDNLDLTYDGYCILAEYLDLKITGSAKLTSTGTTASAISVHEGNLTLNGDFTLTAQKNTGGALYVYGNLTVEGGSLSVINTGDNHAIYVYGAMTVNGGTVTNVTGLTKEEMTGESALDNMIFSYADGEESPWFTKADESNSEGECTEFYPHLKGFNLTDAFSQMTADEIEAADWPAKTEIAVELSGGDTPVYDGKEHTVESVVFGKVSVPEGYLFKCYEYTNGEWPDTGSYNLPTEPGIYKIEMHASGKPDITKYFRILEPDTDYSVTYKVKTDDGWEDTTEPVNAGEYKAIVTFTDTGYVKGQSPIEKDFEIIPASVTLTAGSETRICDGTLKTVNGFTSSVEGLTFEGVTASGSGTDAGTYDVTFSGVTVNETTDTTGNYVVAETVNGTLTINPAIKFVNEDGTELQSGAVALGETPEYTGETPVKEDKDGYTFDFKGWTPEITPATANATYTATYTKTAIEYKAKFVDENGETVEEVPYTVETESITEPAVPEKQGYAGEWEEYELTIGGITVKPVYANISSIEIEDYTDSSESGYREERTFTVNAENLPEGAEIHWFVNGEDVGTGESYTVEDPTEDYNIYAAVVDADGNTLDETQVQAVKVRNGFMDKLKWFFSDFWNNIFKAVIDAIIKAC